MRIPSFCLLLLFTASVHAQQEGAVVCRFVGLEGAPPPPPLVHVGAGGADVPCDIPPATFSPPTPCTLKDGAIHFLAKADRKPAATARIPAGVNKAILLFVAGAPGQDALPWRVFVIEDSPKNFPDGGAYVANFHQQDIRFVLGQSKLMLKPGSAHGFERPEKRDAFNMAPVIFQFQQKEDWRTASESMLRFTPGVRYLIIAYVDPASKRPRIATYQDFVVRPAAPPAP